MWLHPLVWKIYWSGFLPHTQPVQWMRVYQKEMILNCQIKLAVRRVVCFICACGLASHGLSLRSWWLFFFKCFIIRCGKFRSLYWQYMGKATAVTRAALPMAIPASACSIFLSPNSGIAASSLYDQCKRGCTESWLGGKSLTAPENSVSISTVPRFLVQHFTSWMILPSNWAVLLI